MELELVDWAALILVGGIPWITQLQQLDIHFEIPNLKLKTSFNIAATIFAMALFLFIKWESPRKVIASLPKWGWFFILAVVSFIVFFSFFILFRDQIKEGKKKAVIIGSIFVYILLFSSLTVSFGILRIHGEHEVFEGRIISSLDSEPVNRAELKLQAIKPKTSVIMKDFSDEDGNFLIVIDKEEFSKCKRVLIERDGFMDLIITIQDVNILEEELQLLTMTKVEDEK